MNCDFVVVLHSLKRLFREREREHVGGLTKKEEEESLEGRIRRKE